MANTKRLIAYTDGSCIDNPGGAGGWAYVMYDEKEHRHGSRGPSSDRKPIA